MFLFFFSASALLRRRIPSFQKDAYGLALSPLSAESSECTLGRRPPVCMYERTVHTLRIYICTSRRSGQAQFSRHYVARRVIACLVAVSSCETVGVLPWVRNVRTVNGFGLSNCGGAFDKSIMLRRT